MKEPLPAAPVPASRTDREAAFHDAAFAGDQRAVTAKYYAAVRRGKAHYRDLVLAECRDRRILEYGCGMGSAAFDLAGRGACVTGIDISRVGIDTARDRARQLGLLGPGAPGSIDLRQMNAEDLDFESGVFDRVCGSGILHHLDLARAVAEVRRVLAPEGEAVFFEPLGHNPLINLYRRLTPGLRSADEQPLSTADLRAAAAGFKAVDVRCFGLTTLLSVPCRGLPGADRLLAGLERLDGFLLRAGPLRRYAWVAVLHLRGPRARQPDEE